MAQSSPTSPTTPSSPNDGTPSCRRNLCILLARMSLESQATSIPSPTSLNPDAAELEPAPTESSATSEPSDLADMNTPPSPGTPDHGPQAMQPAPLATIQADYLFEAASETYASASSVDELVGHGSLGSVRSVDLPLRVPISFRQPPRRYRAIHQHQVFGSAFGAIRAGSLHCPSPADSANYTSAFIVQNETAGIPGSTEQPARVRYLPLAPLTDPEASPGTATTSFTILPHYRRQLDASLDPTPAVGRTAWPIPGSNLPREVFDLIITSLSRDDVKSMRLVCREFEKKVSRALFHTAVVPFNTELYDMVDEDTKKFSHRSGSNTIGGGATYDVDQEACGLSWQNAKHDSEGKLYKGHGLRVFQGFGPHIKKFGMSFEVTEQQLAYPPIKKELDLIDSYHGTYEWPRPAYTRFNNLAGLERIADDTMRMKAAFANLKAVTELGLSIDSGLGWLNGPDRSIRALVFDRPSLMFGQSEKWAPDRQQEDAVNFWRALEQSHAATNSPYRLTETSFARHHLVKPLSQLPTFSAQYAETSRWPSMSEKVIDPFPITNGLTSGSHPGCLYTTHSSLETAVRPAFDQSAVVPLFLRKEQREWLLETEWAQRAFLECYMLAIIDNHSVFQQVTTLNISKLSSGFLPALAREQFWNALTSLTDVTILVKPDWRSVGKDVAGCAHVSMLNPSEAVRTFHHAILYERICSSSTITKLNVGWSGGGEHAEGIFARNNHLLPAPVTSLDDSIALHPSTLFFPSLEHLTLTNCWITPPTLESLITSHVQGSMRNLVLESVSLTAHPNAQFIAPQYNGGAVFTTGTFMARIHSLQHHRPMAGLAQRFRELRLQQPVGSIPNPNLPLPPGQNPGLAVPSLIPNAVDHNNSTHVFVNHMYPNDRNYLSSASFDARPDAPRWADYYREGSWPHLLANLYSRPAVDPVPIDTYFRRGPRVPPPPAPKVPTLELRSCGYARFIHRPSFNQHPIEALDGINVNDDAGGGPFGRNILPFDSYWFHSRHATLRHDMLHPIDHHLARLVQRMPEAELDALLHRWGLIEGWLDSDAPSAPEFDGYLPGGTGRVSGIVYPDMTRPFYLYL